MPRSTVTLAFTFALAMSAVPAAAQDTTALPPVADPAAEETRFDLDASLAIGDRTLSPEEAARLAVERSHRIVAADAGVAAAEASVRRATAALVPRLDLGARYSHVDGFPDGAITTPGGTLTIHIPRDQFSFTARITVLLSDTIFALLPALEGAEGRVRAEELRVEAARHDVELQAVEAYYRYAEARGLRAVAEAAATAARDRLAMIEASITAGVLTPPDRLAAEAIVAQAEEAIARADGAVALTGASLRILIGDDGHGSFGVAAMMGGDGTRSGSIEEAEVRAIADRAELRALREAIESQRHLRSATEATAYPHLGLYLAGDVSNPSPRVFPQREEFFATYEIGATLTWSPSDLLTSVFQSEELAAQIERAEAELAVVEDAVRLELRQAWEAVGSARESRSAAEAALRSAEEAYAARAAQLAAGEAVLTELVTADVRVTEAQLAVLRARMELALASARLDHALGEPE